MIIQILVSNKSTVSKTEIILINDGADFEWGYGESMQEWIKSGRLKTDWPRHFSIVIVTDATQEFKNKLLETLPNGMNKYHFKDPALNDPMFTELYHNGQVSESMATVNTYLIERA